MSRVQVYDAPEGKHQTFRIAVLLVTVLLSSFNRIRITMRNSRSSGKAPTRVHGYREGSDIRRSFLILVKCLPA